MKKNNSAQRQLVLCICDQSDLEAARNAPGTDWADRITLLHAEGLTPAPETGASEASDLVARHGFLAGLSLIDAPLRRGPSSGRVIVTARASHCPSSAELALMEKTLERSARQALVTVGGHCLHLDLERGGPTLFAGRLATSEPAEPLASDRLVHIPGRDVIMLDPDVGNIWSADVNNSAVSMRPAGLALANLLANRGLALLDFARPAPCTGLGSQAAAKHFMEELSTDALEISRFSAFMFQADLWNEPRSVKRAEQCQCPDVDLSLLRAAPSAARFPDIPELEPVFAALTAQLGAGLDALVGQSKQRRSALQAERAKHGSVPGDVFSARKPAPDFDQVPALPDKRDRVIFSVATYHKRVKELGVTLASIYDQADEIHVYLNDLETVPDYCNREKITVHRGQDFANLSAAGKMYFLSEPREGYIFIIDDDNILPPDYAEKMIRLIELYKRRVAVTVHGSTMVADSGWYYRRYGVHAYQRPLGLDKFVNLPGSGTFAYHTDTLKLDFEMFQPYVLVDLAVAIACRNQGVPIVCARRPERWLKLQDSAVGAGLWEDFVVKPTIHTPAMLENGPWDLEHHAAVIMPVMQEVFGELSTEQMLALGLDADFLTKLKDGECPHAWSAANNVYSVTGGREKNRTAAVLNQCLDHAEAICEDEQDNERAGRYAALLGSAYANKTFEQIDGLLMNWAVFAAGDLHPRLERSKKEWAIARALRDLVARPNGKSLRGFAKTLWDNA